MVLLIGICQLPIQFPSDVQQQVWSMKFNESLQLNMFKCHSFSIQKAKRPSISTEKAKGPSISTKKARGVFPVKRTTCPNDIHQTRSAADKGFYSEEYKKTTQKTGKKEHHLWHKRDSTKSGQKALNLIRNISELPNEKEAVYGALDKWIAWEPEFPLIAAAKTLKILRRRNQWVRLIQVTKWMLSKGQGATMATYDLLLLAFDMDQRVDEAETLWNMILHAHTRSISKQLFSRMISLYDHHHMPDKIIEVFADMEELGVKPDEDSLRKIARAFQTLGQADKRKLVLSKYLSKWKYIHFNGERVRVRRTIDK